jgi:tetratricopeptide (TPR) repeat protein
MMLMRRRSNTALGAGLLAGILAATGPAEAETARAGPEPSADAPAIEAPATEPGETLPAGWRRLTAPADTQALLDAAHASGGLALVLLESQRCASCRGIAESLAGVGEAGTDGFVLGLVHQESEAGQVFVQQHQVVAHPTLVAVAPDGRAVARLYPIPDRGSLADALSAVREGRGSLAALEDAAIENPFDLDLAFEVGRQHALRGDAIGAKRHFARLFVFRRMVDQSSRAVVRGAADVGRLGRSDDFGPVRSAVEADLASVLEGVDTLIASAYFALGEYVYIRSHQDWANGLRILDELRRRFPDSPEASAAALSIGLAHHHLGSDRRARAELARYLESHRARPDHLLVALRACADGDILVEWARQEAEAFVEAHPGHAGLWNVVAELRERTEALEDALDAARRAANLDETHPWYRAEVARLEAAVAAGAETEDPDTETDPEAEAETSRVASPDRPATDG